MVPRSSATGADWGLLTALVALWGSAFMLTSLTIASIPPLTTAATRLACGLGVLLLALKISGQSAPPLLVASGTGRALNPAWKYLGAIGFFGNALPFGLIAWGQTHVASNVAGIFMAFAPLTTLILAHFLIRSEPITTERAVGFGLGFVGIAVLMGPEAVASLTAGDGGWGYRLALLCSAVSYGFSNVIARLMPPLPSLSAAMGLTLVATILMAPLALAFERPWTLAPTLQSLGAIAALGLLSTGLANVAFFALIARTGATFLALTNYLIPPWAVLMGVVVLQEPLGKDAVLALGLILAGVAIAQIPRQRHAENTPLR